MRSTIHVVAGAAFALSFAARAEAQSVDRMMADFSVDMRLASTERIGTCNRLVILVRNGGASTTNAVTLRYETWDTYDYERGDTRSRQVKEVTLQGLAAGETRTLTLPDLMISRYGVRAEAHVDADNRFTEAKESDNRIYEYYRPAAYCHAYTIDDVSVSEGGVATFTIRRSGGTGPRTTQYISYSTVNGTATGGSSCSGRSASADFIATSGSLSFSRFDYAKTVTVQTCADRTVEGSETFTMRITEQSQSFDAGTTITKGTGTATVR